MSVELLHASMVHGVVSIFFPNIKAEENLTYDYELYRGIRNKPMQVIHQKFITPRVMSAVAILDGDNILNDENNKNFLQSNKQPPSDFFKEKKQPGFLLEMKLKNQLSFDMQVNTKDATAYESLKKIIMLLNKFEILNKNASVVESEDDEFFSIKMDSEGRMDMHFQAKMETNIRCLFLLKFSKTKSFVSSCDIY